MRLFIVASILSLASAAQKCCPGVPVCFTNNYPFHEIPLPNCAEDIEPSTVVFTRAYPNGQTITRNTVPPALDDSKRTIFIVHGWVGNYANTWMHDMRADMLNEGDYNVIVTGWQGGAGNLWYPQSASDTRTVGAEIALIIDMLKARYSMSPSQFYCTGHSLGSHVCGHAGQRTHIGRITGMDPAGPNFEHLDWSVGLNPSCADLVDVIHTNGIANIVLNLGTMKRLGHVDIYPAGGRQQPGCLLDPLQDDEDVDAKGDLVACSHMRVLDLYKESILSPCFGVRDYDCQDEYDLPNSCIRSGSPVTQMGFKTDQYSARGIFYIDTNRSRPFCMG